jgi:hypothetical protein
MVTSTPLEVKVKSLNINEEEMPEISAILIVSGKNNDQ